MTNTSVSGGLTTPLRRHARNRPDAVAIRSDHRTVTYGQLDDEVAAAAAGLSTLGVEHGSTVALFMPNSVEWLVSYFAVARIGAIATPVNVLASGTEVASILDEIDARVLVTVPDLLARLGDDALARTGHVVVVGENQTRDDATDWQSLLDHGHFDGPGPASTDIASFYYSSATTGRSKAAVTLHTDIVINSMQQVIEMGLTSDDQHLVTASMSWAAGIHGVTLATLYAGGAIILPELGAMNAEKLGAAIADWNPTTVILVPTLLRRLIDHPESLDQLRSSSLHTILTGSEPVPLPLFERVTEELPNIQVMQGYGMSEFPMLITLLRPEDARARVGSAGRATMFTEIEILNSDGDRVRSGEGEILLRSPCTTRRYWERPEETAAAMRDGWLHTGDLGRLDEDGYLWITGRSKDLIITGGLNVAPLEVERVLARATGGREVAVVGVTDPEYGERIVAVFGGPEPVESDDLKQACAEVLPSYKFPRAYCVFGDELPKGPTGKILKRAIRPWAEQELNADAPATTR